MKNCTKCGHNKPLEKFSRNRAKKDGLQAQCKMCRKESQRKHYLANKDKVSKRIKRNKQRYLEQWIEYKETLECELCGEDHSPCLEFHHLDPNEKDFNIASKVKDMTFDTIMEEVKKCAVLCANCHRKVHSGFISL